MPNTPLVSLKRSQVSIVPKQQFPSATAWRTWNRKELKNKRLSRFSFQEKNLPKQGRLVRPTSDFNTKIFWADILWRSRCPTRLEHNNNYQAPHSFFFCFFFVKFPFPFCTKCLRPPACSVLEPRRGAWWRAECWRRSDLPPDTASVCSRSTPASSGRGPPNVHKPSESAGVKSSPNLGLALWPFGFSAQLKTTYR